MADDNQQRLDAAKAAGQSERDHAQLQADARWFSESMVMQRGLFDKLTIEQLRYFSFAAAKLMHKRLGEKLAESREQIETDSRLIRERDDMLFKHDNAIKETRTAIRDVANEVGVEFKENAPLRTLYALRDEVRALRAQLGAEKSTTMAQRHQINEIITTSRSLEEKVYALSIERAGLQARLRAQEDPSDEKVINEATTRFLAILNEKGTWPGSIQDRVGVAYRDVLGILREAAMAKPEVTMNVAHRVLNAYVKHLDATRTTTPSVISLHAALREVFSPAPPPIPPIPLVPSPTAIAQGEQNDRVLAQRTRILAAADNTPRSHNELWRRAGSPQYDNSAAFDVALLQLADEGKLTIYDNNGLKMYRLP